MAKSKSPDEAILDGLRKAYDALPGLMPLTGTKAIFTAKQADLAAKAVSDGLLSKRVELTPGGRGKKPKEVVHGELTEAGVRKVVEKDNPAKTLEALLPAVQAIGKPSEAWDLGEFRDVLEKATTTCVKAIQGAFAEMQAAVLDALTPAGSQRVDPGPVLGALRAALEKVQTPVIKSGPPAEASTRQPGTSPAAGPELEQQIIKFVEEWARESTVGCQFDVLLEGLKSRHPGLTIGEFHDALRRLHDAERIRLGSWPGMLDDIPEPELALFVSSKVMYHVHPAPRNR